MDFKLNAVNQIVKGTVIYAENESIENVCLILKGRAIAYNNGTKRIVGSGSFIGISDLYLGRFLNTYLAYDNLIIYVFDVKDKDNIEDILNQNKDYHGLMVASLNKTIIDMYKIFSELKTVAKNMYGFLKDTYSEFRRIEDQIGLSKNEIAQLENLEEYDEEALVDSQKIMYYSGMSKIPMEVVKSYYSFGNEVTMYHVEEQTGIIVQLTLQCLETSEYINGLFPTLISEDEDNLFEDITNLALTLSEAGSNNGKLVDMTDKVIDQINVVEKLFNDKCGAKVTVNREHMEKVYCGLMITGEKPLAITEASELDSSVDRKEAVKLLKGSLKKILEYSEIEKEKADKFEGLIKLFIDMKDKMSTEDEARSIRRGISELFFEIYEKIFLKADKDDEIDKVIELFLNFGYVDERLLEDKTLATLYFLCDKNAGGGMCKVYTMREWLTEIYKGRKEPSKSEFDLDYQEMIRMMKKEHKMTKEEETELLSNPIKKLDYEIKNMFKYNVRLANGQVSVFVPILYEELIAGDMEKAYLTTDMVNISINKIKAIDYSVFYRESMYFDKEKKIEKEYIIQEIFPDIILLPTYGVNGIMWQEISGKRHNTPGRFLFPIFIEGDLRQMFVKVMARFRWELCRTMQGTAWNNIAYKSLTSEYADYIQFYRKNRELSEEKKEKLKMQIQKGKNNTREIFAIDYQIWVLNEAEGSVRLNKIARELLATYCPFNKEIRMRLIKQPLFEEAMARFGRETIKKIREIDLRYRSLQKDGIELTDVLIETQKFYTDK